ncbi:MAG TPA: hypothetical protein VGS57_10315 [Thermoanaerobaculia bacterium]|jgi:hypothetical protein|nr:hypothetical protein [Thermoanaerobaculia bacterium]
MRQPVRPLRPLVFACLCQLAIAAAALAQTVNVTLHDPPTVPAHPTADQPVSASVQVLACDQIPIGVERVGQVIGLRYVNKNCPIIPIPTDETVPLGTLAEGTYILRVLEVSNPAQPRIDDEAIFTVAATECPPPADGVLGPQLCLHGGRFSVQVEWTHDPGQVHGFGIPVKLSSDSGAFWFFSDTNYELMVKTLDACGFNDHLWFFAAGLTDVEVDIVVTDNQTGAQRRYHNPIGHSFQPITDTSAFVCPLTPVDP